jgi:hypothetical protein
MSVKYDFLTPVGRIVQGSPFEEQTTNMEGQPLVDANGQPAKRWFVGIAFPKSNPEIGVLLTKMQEVARAGFPHLFNAQGQPVTTFAWKIIDGDTAVDDKGKPYNTREGFAGHYVVRFTSGFAPRCYDSGNNVLTDGNAIKRGFYVRLSGNVVPNYNQRKPGLYWNFNMVQLCGYGPEIMTGPDAATVFGAAPIALPAGASATPVAPVSAPPAGAVPGVPGAVPGVPGAVPGVPGAVPGVPGAVPGVPGAVPGVPGAVPPAQAPTAYLNPAVPAAPAAPAPIRHPQNPAYVSYDGGVNWVQG